MQFDYPKSLEEVEGWVKRKFPELSEYHEALMVQRLKNKIIDSMVDEASGFSSYRRVLQKGKSYDRYIKRGSRATREGREGFEPCH